MVRRRVDNFQWAKMEEGSDFQKGKMKFQYYQYHKQVIVIFVLYLFGLTATLTMISRWIAAFTDSIQKPSGIAIRTTEIAGRFVGALHTANPGEAAPGARPYCYRVVHNGTS